MKKFYRHLLTSSLLLLSTSLFAEGLTLSSSDMQGQLSINQVFNGFGCSGKNISPALFWKNAPKETKSFAITMYDKDAPTGSGWWHWVVFNIPNTTHEIKSNASHHLAKGIIESVTDFGSNGFGGACPPKGDGAHSYETTIYALDVDRLNLNEKSSPALVPHHS